MRVCEVAMGGMYIYMYVSDHVCHYLVPQCALKEAECDSTLPALCTHAGSLLLAQDG